MFKKYYLDIKYNMKNLESRKLFTLLLILLNILLLFKLAPYLIKIVGFLFKLLLPFLIGFTFAFILLPIVNFLVNRKVKRKLAVMIVSFMFVFLIGLLLYLLIPVVIKELSYIITKVPDYITKFEELASDLETQLDFLPIDLTETFSNLEDEITSFLVNIVDSIFDIIKDGISIIITFLTSLILMIYFLIDFDKIINWLKKKSLRFSKINLQEYLKDIRDTMQAYFKGVILVSLILIFIAFILFSIIKLDYVLLLAILIGLTDIIPYIGPYIGGSIAVLVGLSRSLETGGIVLIIVIFLQTIEAWLITPKVQSKSVDIHPIFVLLALLFFGSLLGVMGMLIAVPVVAIIETSLKRYINE